MPIEIFLIEKLRLVSDLFDRFPLVITLGIVHVRDALAIDQWLYASRLEHLHHERSSRARQTRDNDKRLAGFFFRRFRIGTFPEQGSKAFRARRNCGKIEQLFLPRIWCQGAPSATAPQSEELI